MTIPDDDRAEIMRRLETVRQEYGARILLAIESGSRAWGFPSPDSDYDVRFLYVRPLADYVSLKEPRDVIEQPIEGLFDINGWDLRKALNLMLKANPVLSEWVRSPIIYSEDAEFRLAIESLLRDVDERPAAMHHHLSLMKSNYVSNIVEAPEVKLKKYFYCLRPAYALHWMWENPEGQLPMQFGELRAGVDEPADRKAALDDLIAKKATTREIGASARIPLFDTFIEETLERASDRNFGKAVLPSSELLTSCEKLFQSMVGLR